MTACRSRAESLLLAARGCNQTQLFDDLPLGNAAVLGQLLRQFKAPDVPALDLIGEVDQLPLRVRRELLCLQLRLQIMEALPRRFRQPFLDLLHQFTLLERKRRRRWNCRCAMELLLKQAGDSALQILPPTSGEG